MKKIIILQGLPASGKSTYARQLAESEPTKYVIVNRDSIRKMCGKYWVPQREDYITAIEETMIIEALNYDYIPVIDATNLNDSVLDKWRDIANDFKAEIEYKTFPISLEDAIERDSKREGDNKVGECVIERFYNKYKHILDTW